jgi:hypothetical protein
MVLALAVRHEVTKADLVKANDHDLNLAGIIA